MVKKNSLISGIHFVGVDLVSAKCEVFEKPEPVSKGVLNTTTELLFQRPAEQDESKIIDFAFELSTKVVGHNTSIPEDANDKNQAFVIQCSYLGKYVVKDGFRSIEDIEEIGPNLVWPIQAIIKEHIDFTLTKMGIGQTVNIPITRYESFSSPASDERKASKAKPKAKSKKSK